MLQTEEQEQGNKGSIYTKDRMNKKNIWTGLNFWMETGRGKSNWVMRKNGKSVAGRVLVK